MTVRRRRSTTLVTPDRPPRCRICRSADTRLVPGTRDVIQCRACGWIGVIKAATGSRGNIRTEVTFEDGRTIKFRSRAEARYATQVLERLRRAGEIRSWAYEKPVDLIVHAVTGKVLRKHLIDFTVINRDGETELHEVKGHEEDHWTVKREVMEAIYLPAHPGVRYYVIDSKTLKVRAAYP